jgi:O-antigen/teichoic acid export membrane protein
VGWYTTAYKYLDGLNILPSTFTIALFPVLSRYAAGAPDALMRAYVKSLKYLLILALPLAVLSFAYSDFIIYLFGGSAYLPESAIALRLIIGFLPLSFVNNVTHYVLIAVNQQRYLTKAFVVGALFNIGANLIFIPLYSYRAAAVITILSELVLLVPFYIGIRRHVGKVDWLRMLWRPALSAAFMALVVALLHTWLDASVLSFLVIVPAALLTYALALIVSGTFNDDDREMLRLLVPKRLLVLVERN